MPMSSGLFPRNFKKTFPIASRGEGCWIITADGRRFLDASGQAAVVSIGHGVAEIGRAMAEQSSQIAFAHTSQFHTAPAEKLAARLLFPHWRAGLLHFRRLRSHRNGHKTRAPVLHRNRPERALPRSLAPPELSRQHSWRHVRQRKCGSPRAVRTTHRGMGTHCSVFLLPLPFRKNISAMRNRVCRRSSSLSA